MATQTSRKVTSDAHNGAPEHDAAAERPSPIVRGEGLRKVYGEGDAAVEAVRGVDLELLAGQITVLMGASGSGKSSLLHLLSGLDTPTEGTVWLDGRPMADFADAEIARWRALHMGFVLQQNNLMPMLTIEENVAAPLIMAGWRRGKALDRAGELLSAVGIYERRGHWPSGVSGGEAQRAAVARSCVGEPKVIFADEPTGSLDSSSGEAVLGIFRDIAKRTGAAALLVTHDQRVAAIGDRILKVRDGGLEECRD